MENEGAVIVRERMSLTASEIRSQVNLIQEVMQAVMKKDTHYGIIPGCQKPSLWKPGAEKLLVTFRVASDPETVDLSTPEVARYRVTRKGFSILTGAAVGSAVGECSSDEDKYKWRGAVCDAEFKAAPEDGRRLKYRRDGTTVEQVRMNPADVANTILKMADKRAYVALALNVTAASDIFTQDIEDLPEGMIQAPEGKSAPVEPPNPKAPAANPNLGPVISEAQAKRFYAIGKSVGKTDEEMHEYLASSGIPSSKLIPKSVYDACCEWAGTKTL